MGLLVAINNDIIKSNCASAWENKKHVSVEMLGSSWWWLVRRFFRYSCGYAMDASYWNISSAGRLRRASGGFTTTFATFYPWGIICVYSSSAPSGPTARTRSFSIATLSLTLFTRAACTSRCYFRCACIHHALIPATCLDHTLLCFFTRRCWILSWAVDCSCFPRA